MEERILSQEEISTLLKTVPKSKTDTPTKEKKIEEYDIKRYLGITRDHFPIFKEINEYFDFLFEQSISTRTGNFVNMITSEPEVSTLGEFISSASNPTYILMFKLDPAVGDVFMEISPSFVHTLVDMEFGGNGRIAKNPPDITIIERAAMPKIARTLLTDLEKAWGKYVAVSAKVVSQQTNPLTIAPPESTAPILSVSFSLTLDDITMSLRLAYSTEVARALIADVITHDRATRKTVNVELQEKIKQILMHVRVNVFVELGRSSIHVSDLLELKAGDIIPLNLHTDSEIVVYVEDKKKWFGKPGVYKMRMASKITNPYKRR
ncbi:MAG: FliM/FliN family flagellar motor switch protein [bacterium]|nr:FliM/FliN family flagellar motor switch protein [bacterium]